MRGTWRQQKKNSTHNPPKNTVCLHFTFVWINIRAAGSSFRFGVQNMRMLSNVSSNSARKRQSIFHKMWNCSFNEIIVVVFFNYSKYFLTHTKLRNNVIQNWYMKDFFNHHQRSPRCYRGYTRDVTVGKSHHVTTTWVTETTEWQHF